MHVGILVQRILKCVRISVPEQSTRALFIRWYFLPSPSVSRVLLWMKTMKAEKR